jgi:hypothetical protein
MRRLRRVHFRELTACSAHTFSIFAVVTTTVRLVKRTSLEVAQNDPAIFRTILGMTTSNLAHVENHMLVLGCKTALRVAAFLLEMHLRSTTAGVLILPLSRRDIADYTETVSRAISELQQKSILKVEGSTHRHIVHWMFRLSRSLLTNAPQPRSRSVPQGRALPKVVDQLAFGAAPVPRKMSISFGRAGAADWCRSYPQPTTRGSSLARRRDKPGSELARSRGKVLGRSLHHFGDDVLGDVEIVGEVFRLVLDGVLDLGRLVTAQGRDRRADRVRQS